MRLYPSVLLTPGEVVLSEEVAAYPDERDAPLQNRAISDPRGDVDSHGLLELLTQPETKLGASWHRAHSAMAPARHLERGNVCVHFYMADVDADSVEATREEAASITARIEPLGGRVDGFTPGLIASTLRVDLGFSTIEDVLSAAVARRPGAQWKSSNVYDSVTGEALGWWERRSDARPLRACEVDARC